jgi:hypothetical protein
MAALAPNVKKHVDPGAPLALRMMAAKALVPLAPSDMLTVLFLLTSDPDQKVRTTAVESAAKLPDRILSSALRDEELPPPVLGWFLDRFAVQDVYAEMLILNSTTPDDAVARAAAHCSARTAETIGQNQLRLLRHEDVVRQLCRNRNVGPVLTDGVCDFCVRSGADPGRRPPDAPVADPDLRPPGGGGPAGSRATADEVIVPSTPAWATRMPRRWRRGSGSPSPSGSCG